MDAPHAEAALLQDYAQAREDLGLPPSNLRPAELRSVREAIRLGTCDRWPGDERRREFVRTMRGLRSRGYEFTLRAVLNHVGESWGPDGAGEVKYPDGMQVMAESLGMSVDDLRAQVAGGSVAVGGRRRRG